MHKSDFVAAMEGKPWRDRACSYEAADCWGLVVLYYRHVLGIEIHQTPDYETRAKTSLLKQLLRPRIWFLVNSLPVRLR